MHNDPTGFSTKFVLLKPPKMVAFGLITLATVFLSHIFSEAGSYAYDIILHVHKLIEKTLYGTYTVQGLATFTQTGQNIERTSRGLQTDGQVQSNMASV